MAASNSVPAGLAGVLNRPEEQQQRDSAYYSAVDSKHTSTQSNALTPPFSGYQSSIDKTPSPINTSVGPHPLPSPGSGGMSLANMVSPTTDTEMIRRLDRQSGEVQSMNGESNSRRESVNSQLHHNFGDLRLANSPYASNNQSTTSIQSTLQQQRNPGNAERNSASRFSNGYQPNNQRLPDDVTSPKTFPRTAPIISGPALGNIARAPEPTKGQAWAFPEEVVQRLPSAARPAGESVSREGTSFLDSRRSSLADSIASSQFTSESRLPPGQRRLEDGMPAEYQRLSRASSEFQPASHHHHSLQHKQVTDLQSDAGSPGGSQPYSRTPELRVSHKLAERKRRTEMKELFDNLRDMMPQERGSKASKWEILTKAIHEYGRLSEELRKSNHQLAVAKQELEAQRHENNTIRLENAQLREQNKALISSSHPTSHHHMNNQGIHPPPSYSAEFDRSRVPEQYAVRPSAEQLPPLRFNGNMRGPDSMNGIQYHDPPQNGYESRF